MTALAVRCGASCRSNGGIFYASGATVTNTGKKILLVEDHEALRKMLVRVIRFSGYDVIEAATGLAALEAVKVTRPDVILMDLGLPDMDGESVAEILKDDPVTQSIPIVIHTAYAADRTARALKAGAAEVLQKPSSLKDLTEILQKYTSEFYTEPRFRAG